jgi:hypothetical protein
MNCIDPAVNELDYIFTKEAWALYHTIQMSDLGSFWAYFLENECIKKNEIIYAGCINNWFRTIDKEPSMKVKFDIGCIMDQIQQDPLELSVVNLFHTPSQIYYKHQAFETPFDLEYVDYVYLRVVEYIEDLLKCYEYSSTSDLSQIYSQFTTYFEQEWWKYETQIERDMYKMLNEKFV